MRQSEKRRLHMTLILFAYAFALQGNTVLSLLCAYGGAVLGLFESGKTLRRNYKQIIVLYSISLMVTYLSRIGESLPAFYLVHLSNILFVYTWIGKKSSYRKDLHLYLFLYAIAAIGCIVLKDTEVFLITTMIFVPFIVVGGVKQLVSVQSHRRTKKLVLQSNA